MLLMDTVSTEIKFEQYFFGGSVLFQPLFGKIVESYLVSNLIIYLFL